MDPRQFEKEERAALAKAREARKSMDGDESKAVYFDIADTVQSADPNKARPVRVGDARVMPNRVTFLPPETRVYETAGDMAVPRDSFLSPNLGGSQGPTQAYRCEYPDGQKLHQENFLAPGEGETETPADFVAPKPAVLKRAGMFANIINGQDGDGVDAADRFTGGR
jgi:hypothetical protein